jgi:hypothetical protein
MPTVGHVTAGLAHNDEAEPHIFDLAKHDLQLVSHGDLQGRVVNYRMAQVPSTSSSLGNDGILGESPGSISARFQTALGKV